MSKRSQNPYARVIAPTALALAFLLIGAGEAARVRPVDPVPTVPGLAALPVVDDYHGTKIVDRFRFMEDKGPETLNWMKAQGAYTRSVFDSIRARSQYLRRLSALGAQFGVASDVQPTDRGLFYLEQVPGGDVFNLVVMAPDGRKRTLVDTAALIRRRGGIPQAIDYFSATADGTRVAVGISSAGSEQSQLTIIDAANGALLAGPIERAQSASPSWLPDGSGLFFTQRQEVTPKTPPGEVFLNTGVWFWNGRGQPIPIAGSKAGTGPISNSAIFPTVQAVPDSGHALLVGYHGVKREFDLWTATAADAKTGRGRWRQLASVRDGISDATAANGRLYLLSNKNAPTFQILSVPIDGSLADAKTIIPARPGVVIHSLRAASDALYVVVREGIWSRLLRVLPTGKIETLALPFKASVGGLRADPKRPGAQMVLTSWTVPASHYEFDPRTRSFRNLDIDKAPSIASDRYRTMELKARAHDGVEVPLSVITPAGPRRRRPLVIDAYASYGSSIRPSFSYRSLPFLDEGGSIARCHARGGGELGSAWHLAGKDANKPNTWKDLIACAETLIAQGFTTADQLTVLGSSAGGIAAGRAMTDRPDLFAGAVLKVGDLNSLRSETMASGPSNIPEFGSVKTPQGFRNLLAMDSYQHIRDDVQYPAVLLTTGLNDPRVDPWQPAKMAARLMEIPNRRPVLLRVEEAAGHDRGTGRATVDGEEADIAAFVFWRAGLPQWQPAR